MAEIHFISFAPSEIYLLPGVATANNIYLASRYPERKLKLADINK
jgi:hypothetical protein